MPGSDVKKIVRHIARYCGHVVRLQTQQGGQPFMICGHLYSPPFLVDLDKARYTLVCTGDWWAGPRCVLLGEFVAVGLAGRREAVVAAYKDLLEQLPKTPKGRAGCTYEWDPHASGEDEEDDGEEMTWAEYLKGSGEGS